MRLALAVLIASIGAVGMWSVVVVMPVVQPEFAATRGAVSLAATMIFFGFGLGGVITGKITDRLGIVLGDGGQHRLPDRLLCAGRPFDRAVAVHRHLLS